MANYASKVIAIAEEEVGYLEKASGAYLYSKTENAGSGNYTKYGKEMHNIYPAVMDYPAPWCDAFVDWCFYKAYGVSNAKGLVGGNFNDYTPSSANLYKNKNAWHTSPRVGDQIFFKNSKRIYHTGLVYKVDAKKVYTIEGNTSGASGVIANGGGVCKKSYSLSDSRIAGYGRPKYDEEEAEAEVVSQSDAITTIAQIQRIVGTTPDGIYGPKTKAAIVKAVQRTISTTPDGIFGPNSRSAWSVVRKGHVGPDVKCVQMMLICQGYSCGDAGADGDFGNGTLAAVRTFQKIRGLAVDGIVGKNTAMKLFG